MTLNYRRFKKKVCDNCIICYSISPLPSFCWDFYVINNKNPDIINARLDWPVIPTTQEELESMFTSICCQYCTNMTGNFLCKKYQHCLKEFKTQVNKPEDTDFTNTTMNILTYFINKKQMQYTPDKTIKNITTFYSKNSFKKMLKDNVFNNNK